MKSSVCVVEGMNHKVTCGGGEGGKGFSSIVMRVNGKGDQKDDSECEL